MRCPSRTLRAAILLWGLECCIREARAQLQTFQWGSLSNVSTPGVCETIPVGLTATNNGTEKAVPPFFMIAYEWGGPTTLDFLGTDPTNLSWTVRHAQGAQVYAGIVDSQGNSGGIQAFTTNLGTSMGCLPPDTTTPINITTNTTSVNTCNFVGISVQGGKKPYIVSIAPDGYAAMNYTLGPNDDSLSLLNQFVPGSTFVASVSDASGKWSFSTGGIGSKGSTDITCPGLRTYSFQSNQTSSATSSSTSSTSTATPQAQSDDNTGTSKATSRRKDNLIAIIVGASVGAVFLAISAGLAIYFYRDRQRYFRRLRQQDVLTDEITPFVGAGAGGADGAPPPLSARSSTFGDNRPVSMASSEPRWVYSDPVSISGRTGSYSASAANPGNAPAGQRDQDEPLLSAFHRSSVASLSEYNASSNSGALTSSSSALGLHQALATTQPLRLSKDFSGKDRRVDEPVRRQQSMAGVVFQHEDVDDLGIVEVPPAYRDRGNASRPSGSGPASGSGSGALLD